MKIIIAVKPHDAILPCELGYRFKKLSDLRTTSFFVISSSSKGSDSSSVGQAMNTMSHRGYTARIESTSANNILVGRVLGYDI